MCATFTPTVTPTNTPTVTPANTGATAPAPTMSPGVLALMALVLGGFAVVALRRRRRSD